jgi:ribose transport system ATP-binding protein
MDRAQQDVSGNKSGATETAAPLLVLKGLDKRFGATHALKAVDLSFEAGEIHAIVGENGAGKSTLIKLLTGVYPRSGGEVFWQGKPVALATPHEAIAYGINAVHQEVVLCPHLTVRHAARLSPRAARRRPMTVRKRCTRPS